MKKILAGCGLLLYFAVYCTGAVAQKTTYYIHEDADFRQGLDLYEKQKFGSAQRYFQKTSSRIIDKNSLTRINAEFYAALCAMELFNKDAELLLKNFVREHPESPKVKSVYFNLWKYNYRKKDYKETIEWLEKLDVYDLTNDELPEFYFKRGYSYFQEEQVEKAKKDFYEIKDIDTKYTWPAVYYYSHIAYSEKNYETALLGFLKLQSNESFGPIVPYYIAQIYFLQAKYDQVISYASPLINLDSVNPAKRAHEIAKIIGESYYRTNLYKEAIPYLEKYKKSVSLTRTDYYELGYAYYKTGDADNAIDNFNYSTDVNDSLAQNAHYHIADCYLKKGSKANARSSFGAAFMLAFDKTIQEDALFNYAKLSYELSYNPYNEAIAGFNSYIRQYPNSPRADEVYTYLTNVYLFTKNYKDAFASIDSIKNLTSDLKPAYQKVAYLRGVQLFNDNNFDDAIKHLNKSLRYPIEKKYNTQSHYWKGEAFYRLAEKSKNQILLDSAIASYKKFLFEPGAVSQRMFNNVNYNIGYSYFKKSDWQNANMWLRKFIVAKEKEPQVKMNDAFLRIGDGFFMMKDYVNANDYYAEANKIKIRVNDYGLYQQSLVQGLLGKHEAKVNSLTTLMNDYPKSNYIASAKFELAKTYLEKLNNPEKAQFYFQKVVDEHDSTPFVARSLVQIGRILSDKNEYDLAINTLDRVLSRFPKDSISLEALAVEKPIYVAKGDLDTWEEKVKKNPMADKSIASMDYDNFDLAYAAYEKGNYEEAKKYFMKYIQKYPEGIYLIDANFYNGECHFKANNWIQALEYYKHVLDKPFTKFTETALQRAAYIYFKQNLFQEAMNSFAKLESMSQEPQTILESRIGLMRCAFLMKSYSQAINFSNKVIATEKISNENSVEAHLIIAKSAYEMLNYNLAMAEFSTITQLTTNEKGAEAKYNIAAIHFAQANYKESQKLCYELINQEPSYSYWIGKSLLLLSDSYYALQDFFNAKYILKTVIDKSQEPDFITTANEKLRKMEEEEKKLEESRRRKTAEDIHIEFKPDDSRDNDLYDEPIKEMKNE